MKDFSSLLVVVIVVIIGIVLVSLLRKRPDAKKDLSSPETFVPSYQYWENQYPPVWIFLEESLPVLTRGAVQGQPYWTINDLYSFQKACLSSILTHMPNNQIHLVTYQNITQYLPHYNPTTINAFPAELQVDLIKYQLLANYGGIWLTSWTLLFQDLNTKMKLLTNQGCVSIGKYTVTDDLHKGDYPDVRCWVSRPANPLLILIMKNLFSLTRQYNQFSNYAQQHIVSKMVQYYGQSKTISSHYTQLDGRYNGSIYRDHKLIELDYVFSTAEYPFLQPNKMWWYQVDYERLLKSMNYKWFLYQDIEHLLESRYMLAKMVRIALKASTWQQDNPHVSKSLIRDKDINGLWAKKDIVSSYQGKESI